MPEIICYGEAMTLVSATIPVSMAEAPTCRLSPAGAEFNVAAHLAALGIQAGWAGALGRDPFASLILAEATRRGVNTHWVSIDPSRPTGVYFKSAEATGTSIFYYRRGSAAAELEARSLFADTPATPRIIHTTGITAAISETSLRSTRDLVSKRVFPESLVSFDVNFRRPLWSPEEAAGILLELCQASDIVFVGRDEAEQVWGTTSASAIRKLIDGPSYLIVKDGALEATEFAGDAVAVCPAPTVNVLEEVGAGDAFAAGWISAYLKGADAVGRLRTGHLLAAQALQHPGDLFPMPDQTMIEKALRMAPAEWPPELLGRSAADGNGHG